MKHRSLKTVLQVVCIAAILTGGTSRMALGKQGKRKPTPPPPAQPVAADPFEALKSYKVGQSRVNLVAIEQKARDAGVEGYAAIESRLLEVVNASEATNDGKQFACRMLGYVGSGKSIPVLAALLGNEKLSDQARLALQGMNDASAGEALRAALGQVSGKLLIGVITSVGERRDAAAVDAIAKLTENSDTEIVEAAVIALGKIGTVEAEKALEASAAGRKSGLDQKVAEARLMCAGKMARAGKTAEAMSIYQAFNNPKQATAIRQAALLGTLKLQPEAQMIQMVLDILRGNDHAAQQIALTMVRDATSAKLRQAVVDQRGSFKQDIQNDVLVVAMSRGDVKMGSGKGITSLTAAELEAMGSSGTAADVPVLIQVAARNSPETGRAATAALLVLKGEGVDQAIAKQAESGEVTMRVVAIRTMAKRNAAESLPLMVKLLSATESKVQSEAIRVIGSAGKMEHLGTLVTVLGQSNATAAEEAMKSICARSDKAACGKIVMASLAAAKNPSVRGALIRTLSKVGGAEALAVVQKSLTDSNEQVRDAAVRSLSDWPDMAAQGELMNIAKSGTNETQSILALRGYLRLAGGKDVSADQRLTMYGGALAVAKRAEEKRQAIGGLGGIADVKSLDLLVPCLKDESISNEAAVAIVDVAEKLKDRSQAESALKQARAQTKDADTLKRIDQILKNAK